MVGVATRIMRECREEWGEGDEVMSSDEDTLTNQIPDEEEPPFISEEDYRKMLRVHRESQMRKRVSHTPCHAHSSSDLVLCVFRWSRTWRPERLVG